MFAMYHRHVEMYLNYNFDNISRLLTCEKPARK